MEIICRGGLNVKKPEKVNRLLKKYGFDNLLFDINRYKDGYLINEKDVCNDHLEYSAQLGMQNTVAMTPFIFRMEKDPEPVEYFIELIKETISFCTEKGIKDIIVTPLELDETDVNKAKEFYALFKELITDKDTRILIPNMNRMLNGHMIRGIYSDPYKLSLLIDSLNEECGKNSFALCLNIGECNLVGQNIYEFCKVAGNRIKAVCVSENDGKEELRLMPFSSSHAGSDKMDWLSIIRGLRLVNFDGLIIMDFCDTLFSYSHLFWDDVIRLAYNISTFLVWQLNVENIIKKYDTRVLFGAGNMCRNYMKCYGKDYPPLFTCDNDSRIWGNTFEGLEIKSPEELRNLPEDCCILICNMFYDEIKAQLQEMGLKNPIEYFSDEYLPSLYLDRYDADERKVVDKW